MGDTSAVADAERESPTTTTCVTRRVGRKSGSPPDPPRPWYARIHPLPESRKDHAEKPNGPCCKQTSATRKYPNKWCSQIIKRRAASARARRELAQEFRNRVRFLLVNGFVAAAAAHCQPAEQRRARALQKNKKKHLHIRGESSSSSSTVFFFTVFFFVFFQ